MNQGLAPEIVYFSPDIAFWVRKSRAFNPAPFLTCPAGSTPDIVTDTPESDPPSASSSGDKHDDTDDSNRRNDGDSETVSDPDSIATCASGSGVDGAGDATLNVPHELTCPTPSLQALVRRARYFGPILSSFSSSATPTACNGTEQPASLCAGADAFETSSGEDEDGTRGGSGARGRERGRPVSAKSFDGGDFEIRANDAHYLLRPETVESLCKYPLHCILSFVTFLCLNYIHVHKPQ